MSNEKDIAVGAVGAFQSGLTTVSGIPSGAPTKSVPSYLVKLMPELGGKSKTYRMFIAVEQPQFLTDFIHVKGLFSEREENDIVDGYRDMIASATSAQILEMWIPWHSIHSVRSLVFKTASKK